MSSSATIPDPEAAFAALAGGDPSVDRYRLFDRLREDLPVFHSDAVDAWVLTRYDDVFAVLERRGALPGH